ncbi:MAG: alpha/beta fold hydrolase [Planctomycetota bacterium]
MPQVPNRHHTRVRLACAASLILASAAAAQQSRPASNAAPATATAPVDLPQWWTGRVELPGMPLDFLVVFRPGPAGGPPKATMDIPMQGAKDLALTDVALGAEQITFTIPPPAGAVFSVEPTDGGRAAVGTLAQRGMTFTVNMQRVTENEARAFGPPRPQTPKPPFPYTARDVTYDNPKDGAKLAGTLTIPEGQGPHPAVLLITGSGGQDRDETIFGHKPFAVIADHLTRRGIAVLRVDDRGVGGSTNPQPDVTSETFATDVDTGIAFLRKQAEIDPRRIALLGHSEGALVATLVAARMPDLAGIVLLAGTALPGSQILPAQLAALSRAAGMSAELVEKQTAAQLRIFKHLDDEPDSPALRAAARELVRLQLEAGGTPADPNQLETATDLALKQVQNPWMRFFLRYDPREPLRKVKCPVLALGGGLDLQVLPKDNLPEIEKALRGAGNGDVTVKELPGLNHLFQEAQTGLVQEYATLKQTVAPAVLDETSDWLQKRLGLPASPPSPTTRSGTR